MIVLVRRLVQIRICSKANFMNLSKGDGATHRRDCPVNYRMRLQFETDARDDYFSRRIEGGKFWIVWIDKAGKEHKVSIVGPNLRSGAANVMVTLPDAVEVGDILAMTAVTKDSRAEFENKMEVTVRPWAERRKGGETKPRHKKPSDQPGKDRERPRELATPEIDPVYRDGRSTISTSTPP
jgi:hypothetical protein